MFDEFGDPIDVGGGLPPDDFSSADDPASGDFGGILGGGGALLRTAFTPRIPGGPGQRGYNFGMSMGRAARTIVTSMGSFSVAKVWDLTKRFGPDVAAGVVGMSVVDLVTVLAHSGVMHRRRRRRGISARDVRTARRVVHFAHSILHKLGARTYSRARGGRGSSASVVSARG